MAFITRYPQFWYAASATFFVIGAVNGGSGDALVRKTGAYAIACIFFGIGVILAEIRKSK